MESLEFKRKDVSDIVKLTNDGRYLVEADFHGFLISSLFHWKGSLNRLVVLLPSALPRSKERVIPSFLRWSWSDLIDGNVLSIDDPTIKMADIYGGWFQGRTNVSAFEAVADFVKDVAHNAKIKNDNIVFYGSSIGGFSGLVLSSFFPGSVAVAEVPQIDLKRYPVKSAVIDLEEKIYRRSIEEESMSSNSFTCVYDVFTRRRVIPNSIIVTNTSDEGYELHCEYLDFVKSNIGGGDFSYIGSSNIVVTDKVKGHKALGKMHGISLVNFSTLFK